MTKHRLTPFISTVFTVTERIDTLSCESCNKEKCRNGLGCDWKKSGNCFFCHCYDSTCQNFDDCKGQNIESCDCCSLEICENCREVCEECSKQICVHNTNSCGEICSGCDLWFCPNHIAEIPPNSEFSSLCLQCYEDMKDIVHGDYSSRDGHEYQSTDYDDW